MAIVLGGQREKNRWKEGHSGGTYAYMENIYREYPPGLYAGTGPLGLTPNQQAASRTRNIQVEMSS